MSEFHTPASPPEFDMEEGLALALSYLENPSDVPCPRCGPGRIEVVCYLDARCMEEGTVIPTAPENDYTVVLYCHGCGRAAALDLSREDRQEGREAA
jgi:DNA-binding transcriptional LysR family regulator